jgi:hypothetical protein
MAQRFTNSHNNPMTKLKMYDFTSNLELMVIILKEHMQPSQSHVPSMIVMSRPQSVMTWRYIV